MHAVVIKILNGLVPHKMNRFNTLRLNDVRGSYVALFSPFSRYHAIAHADHEELDS